MIRITIIIIVTHSTIVNTTTTSNDIGIIVGDIIKYLFWGISTSKWCHIITIKILGSYDIIIVYIFVIGDDVTIVTIDDVAVDIIRDSVIIIIDGLFNWRVSTS
jgi:hypothetical protein